MRYSWAGRPVKVGQETWVPWFEELRLLMLPVCKGRVYRLGFYDLKFIAFNYSVPILPRLLQLLDPASL